MMRDSLWLALATVVAAGCSGQHEGAGQPAAARVAAPVVAARAEHQTTAMKRLIADDLAVTRPTKQVLFGDLHVHTTFSADAFARSLPMLQGEGAHPPADACDFARFCSGLDFWSINDHAEGVSPQHWKETKEAIRQCNAVAGDPANPDLVSFLGWEWTQVGATREDHYGHKNVIFRDTAEEQVPRRPISALNDQLIAALRRPPPFWDRIRFPLYDWENRQRYFDFGKYQNELRDLPLCPEGVDTHKLPDDCHERASTPQVLFEKLAQWGFETLVIPHGTTWGFYTPAGTTLDKQLTATQHDPERQTLFEVYSGHGNSEQYRSWKAIDWDPNGNPVCPDPTKDYEPCCWRAGEIIRARCGNVPAAECERRVAEARTNFLKAGVMGRNAIPGATIEDWMDCGQCRDCFNPAYNYRPGNSAQYALAISNFDDPAEVHRFQFGFIASSDNHSARPGTGYKEFARRAMTEAAGARDATWRTRIIGPDPTPAAESVPFDPAAATGQIFTLLDTERQASFFMTGGLVAVHAEGRDRNSIWAALKRREVYGTSGDRILLWFEIINAPDGVLPMGSQTHPEVTPIFRIRAVGSLKQKPGCPDSSTQALAPERLQHLCHGECYNPTDERHLITRLEIVRIRPQQLKGEPVGPLIEDAWRRYDCPPDPAGCELQIEDPDFLSSGRDAVYYARALQEATPAVNAGGLRCEYNAAGECVKVNPCYGDYRTPYEDDCLTQNQERAWSSPIYLRK